MRGHQGVSLADRPAMVEDEETAGGIKCWESEARNAAKPRMGAAEVSAVDVDAEGPSDELPSGLVESFFLRDSSCEAPLFTPGLSSTLR